MAIGSGVLKDQISLVDRVWDGQKVLCKW
jgi:hypothetical protein